MEKSLTLHPPVRLTRRARLCLAIALSLCFFSFAGTAFAADPGALELGQGAQTGQGAAASGESTQTEPVNVVVSVRIDSPGNDGPISQSNVAVGGVAAGNGSDTAQTGDPGSSQQAATGQEATANGVAKQAQPTNIVVSIRIDSPGNDGPVSQNNTAVVGVSADNAALTTQNGPGGEKTLKTAVPLEQGLRHDAALAEAADDTTASYGRRSAPRRSARVPAHVRGHAAKSLGRPVSGAAAAVSAGFPAAVARASSERNAARAPARADTVVRPASMLHRFASVLPTSIRADRPAGGPGPLMLTAIALLGALLVWASSSWLAGARATWRRRG